MPGTYCEIFRRLSRPLEPIPTGQRAMLRRLPGIRAVLFDVYGTLFVSDSGEVGTAGQPVRGSGPPPPCPLDEALEAMGIRASTSAAGGVEHLFRLIEASHARSRATGIDYPEVDIVELWREVLAELVRRGVIDLPDARGADPRRLAVEYEARANPCWPMPHVEQCLERLRLAGKVLGLVSNAQFYTPELFEALLGRPAENWGLEPDLQFYSYFFGSAKPGLAMFQAAASALADRRIAPGEALYLGNDMLNDVACASELGLRTALFAGDARSLRLRPERADLDGISPDLVLTDLTQLAECIII